MRRRAYILFIAFSMAILANFSAVLGHAAEEYPTRPVEIVNPFGAGGSTDLTMRGVVSVANQYLGQPMIPIIKSGSSGVIGSNYVAKSKPDGYTIMIGGATAVLVNPIFKKIPYKSKDFVPICRISASPWIISVLKGSPWKTFQDFLDAAKKNPKKVKYVSSGMYNHEHILFSLLEQRSGIQLTHVPTGGGGEALTMYLGGHVDIIMSLPATTTPHIIAGTVRPLAVIADERVKFAGLEEVPTLRELGFDITSYMFNAIFAVSGTPQPIIQKLRTAMEKICLEDKTFKRFMARLNEEIKYLGGEKFAKFLEEQEIVITNIRNTLMNK